MKRYAIAVMVFSTFFMGAGLASAQSAGSPTVVLTREQASAILPQSVFYRGQNAPVQGRNSTGLKQPDGKLVLFAIVDTSGYSSSVQETFQAYLLAEVPLLIGGKTLKPGAYGFGFISDNKMVVMDIGGNEVLRVATMRDDALTRPNPLQVLPDPSGGTDRLYLGRSYVTISTAAR